MRILSTLALKGTLQAIPFPEGEKPEMQFDATQAILPRLAKG